MVGGYYMASKDFCLALSQALYAAVLTPGTEIEVEHKLSESDYRMLSGSNYGKPVYVELVLFKEKYIYSYTVSFNRILSINNNMFIMEIFFPLDRNSNVVVKLTPFNA